MPQNTLAPAGEVARDILSLFRLIFWMAAVVFVVVQGLLIYAIIRFRRRPGDTAMPAQVHGNTPLEVAWTIAPAIVLAVIAVPTIQTIGKLAEPPDDKPIVQVNVTGHQWWWEFQFPELGVLTANELHIPVGSRVDATLRSADVIHSFWVPRLSGKSDVFPGTRTTSRWFDADAPGEYQGQCAELCGASHALMKFRVIAQTQADFDAWVRSQKASAAATTGAGPTLFTNRGCGACHTIEGLAQGKVGPNLTHLASRGTLAAGMLTRTDANIAKWLANPPAIKPGSKMPNLGLAENEIQTLVAYLQSLK